MPASIIEFRVNLRLGHAYDYVRKLEEQLKIECDGFHDRWELSKKLKERIGPMLVEELLRGNDAVTNEQIHSRIEQLVDQEIEEFLEPN